MEHDDASDGSNDGQEREKLRVDFDTCSKSRHLIQQNSFLNSRISKLTQLVEAVQGSSQMSE